MPNYLLMMLYLFIYSVLVFESSFKTKRFDIKRNLLCKNSNSQDYDEI